MGSRSNKLKGSEAKPNSLTDPPCLKRPSIGHERRSLSGAVIGLTGIGGEFEKADIQHPTGRQSARHFAQVQSNTAVEVQISESPL